MKHLIVSITYSLILTFAGVAHAESPVCTDIFAKRDAAPFLTVREEAAVESKEEFNAFDYYWGKIKELKELDGSVPYAVTLRALIMQTTFKRVITPVPLRELHLIHEITHQESQQKLLDRIDALQKMKAPDGKFILTTELMSEHLPSKNLLRAIISHDGEYVVFDGNGRLVAIREAFSHRVDDLMVEVEVFHSNSRLMQKVLEKLRNYRGVSNDAAPAGPRAAVAN